MKNSDIIKLCLINLKRRKFRTLLTIAGVIIGTAAIISMVSFAIGIRRSTDSFISSWGDLSIITVTPGADGIIDDDLIATISSIEDVEAATPFWEAYYMPEMRLFAGNQDRYSSYLYSLIGVHPDALEKLGYNIAEGEVKESTGKTMQLVVGSNVPYDFIDSKRSDYDNRIDPFPDPVTGEVPLPFFDPLKENLTLKMFYDYSDISKFSEYDAQITGILSGEDSNSNETRYTVYMNVDDMTKLVKDYKKLDKSSMNNIVEGYTSAKVKVGNIKSVSAIENTIKSMGYETYSLENERQNALKETQNLQIILGALGIVSLVVSAISIANTMIMSVYERTREIGIMKVVGCFVEDIHKMFLMEAAMIGFTGGVVGVAVSFILSILVNYISSYLRTMGGGGIIPQIGYMLEPDSKISVIPLWLMLSGLLFSTIIGILSGLYPASRAVRIGALEAIKQD